MVSLAPCCKLFCMGFQDVRIWLGPSDLNLTYLVMTLEFVITSRLRIWHLNPPFPTNDGNGIPSSILNVKWNQIHLVQHLMLFSRGAQAITFLVYYFSWMFRCSVWVVSESVESKYCCLVRSLNTYGASQTHFLLVNCLINDKIMLLRLRGSDLYWFVTAGRRFAFIFPINSWQPDYRTFNPVNKQDKVLKTPSLLRIMSSRESRSRECSDCSRQHVNVWETDRQTLLFLRLLTKPKSSAI